MPHATFFVQECPTCGRRAEVRVEYLGRQVICDHCHGRFMATDPNGVASGSVAATSADLLRRAERLLQVVAHQQTAILRPRHRAATNEN